MILHVLVVLEALDLASYVLKMEDDGAFCTVISANKKALLMQFVTIRKIIQNTCKAIATMQHV